MSEQRTLDEALNEANARRSDPATSKRAAEKLVSTGRAATLCARVWRHLYDFGPMTSADLADDVMNERRDVISPRMVTLEAAGLVRRKAVDGRRIVWEALPTDNVDATLAAHRGRQVATGFDARLAEFERRLVAHSCGEGIVGPSVDAVVAARIAREVFNPRRKVKP